MAAYSAAVSLKRKIGRILSQYSVCFAPPSLKLLNFAYEEVKSFQYFLKGVNSSSRKRMNTSLQQITEAIRKFDDALISHVSNQIESQPDDESNVSLYPMDMEDLKQEIHSFADELKKIKEEYFNKLCNPLPEEEKDGADAVVSRIDIDGNKSKMVGLSDVYINLKDNIICESEHKSTNILSLVGTAGIGKTTLAKEIFEDPDIEEHFDCCVWVAVGKSCQPNEISQASLTRVDHDMHKMHIMEEDEKNIGQYVKESLKGERYLIVLDDVWDAQVCRHLKNFLPGDRIDSRVLLTTRSKRVAKDASFFSGNLLEMRLLNEEESWDLFCEKVFSEKSCPPQFMKAGKKIVEYCEGLPLTIVKIASLLSETTKMTPEYWSEVAAQKKHQLLIKAYDEILEVLYPSYENLTAQLKLCFLYMGVFPQNYKIPRSKLINLWIVEGFLESNTVQSSKDCAAECLEELVSNTLVMVHQMSTKRSSKMSIEATKTCGLHSSWWYLCYKEARNNNFFYVLNSRKDRLGEGIKDQSRLSIHNNVLFGIKDVFNSLEKNCASTARSLLCLGPYHQYPVPICFGLNLLQNFDALEIRLYEFPLEVLELVWLRYLAINCNGELPASIFKLQDLQFLIIHRHFNITSGGAPSCLPMEIWDMKELKHLQIMGSDLPDLCGIPLPNLLTLLDVSAHSCTKSVFERIPNLEKLGIRIELAPDSAEPLCCFDHVSQLDKLESLKCVIVNPEFMYETIATRAPLSILPSGIKKLSLSGLGYSWEEMSKIASLPCLEVLKLRCYAFQGPKWEIEENGFKKLRFLIIEDTDLVQWKVGRGSFKRLEHVSIKCCYKLKEFHWEFDFYSLKIEVVDCNPLVERKIKEAMLRKGYVIEDRVRVLSSWNGGNLKP